MLSSFGRVRRMTERAAQRLATPVDVLELDVNKPEDLEALAVSWGSAGAAWTACCTRSPSPRRMRLVASS